MSYSNKLHMVKHADAVEYGNLGHKPFRPQRTVYY